MWQQLIGSPKGWIQAQEGMNELWISLAFVIVILTVAILSVRKLVYYVEYTKNHLLTVPISLVITGTIGLTIGLLVGLLSSFIMIWLGSIGEIIRAILMSIFGYIGLRIGLAKSQDILSFWKSESVAVSLPSTDHKMIDSNIAIDGRIIELCQDRFIEGPLLVPDFILHELQLLADSSDTLRRHRGKRGLEVITHLQQLESLEVVIENTKYEETEHTDNKLIRLALDKSATLITNDSNLQQLAQLQHIHVLNLHTLASIMKPILRAGQIVQTTIMKSGKEAGQGIAYLEDGTMIVVEDSQSYIGRECEVIVTSVLQTANGKMIFAKLYRTE
ncbi:putative PIN and TRAM-domain containing protein [Paenibacillus nuruki]|uniref:Putative PIN and TRAM-domain containing protein n=1 Tax=Paenibacillus nuruki TaxID=1886670 RepID=A0A1E3L1Z5_9BACL|nr:TRAM domain-containing protein [Paenibacillus nuruki]ODP27631.1 putative PIN and TRAM-domain containing protein [Paenibacillus nuruki]